MIDPEHPDEPFILSSPEVVRVRAAENASDEAHGLWYVGYAPEKEPSVNARVVYGSLHAASTTSYGDITVFGLFYDTSGAAYEDDESLERALAQSAALETLYDYARTSLRTVLAVIGSDVETSDRSPMPEFGKLRKVEDEQSEAVHQESHDF